MTPHSICSVLSCKVCRLRRSNNKFRLRKLLLGTGYFTSTSYHSLSLYNCHLLHTSHHSFSSSMPPTQILLPLLQFRFLRVMIARIYEWRALRLGMSGMSLHQSIERESQSCLNELGTVTNITCLSMIFNSSLFNISCTRYWNHASSRVLLTFTSLEATREKEGEKKRMEIRGKYAGMSRACALADLSLPRFLLPPLL